MSWLALMLQQVTCLLSLCVRVCMCELMQSEIVRNTGITGRSSLSDEMDARLLLRRSNHTHIYSLRGGGVGVPRLHRFTYDAQTHTCLDVDARAHLLTIKQMCAYKRACPHTNRRHAVSSQTVHILLGCAPINRINEELSHFTVKQRVGLWGKKWLQSAILQVCLQ